MVLWEKMLTVLANSKQTDIPSGIVRTCHTVSHGHVLNSLLERESIKKASVLPSLPHDSSLQTKAVREEDGRKAQKTEMGKKKCD